MLGQKLGELGWPRDYGQKTKKREMGYRKSISN
jgi:hypothetical protein